MKGRRRITFKLLVFVLLGAIINVAVAWAFACWGAVDEENVHRIPSKAKDMLAERGIRNLESSNISGAQVSGWGLTFTSAIAESEPSHIVVLTHAGWPTKSMGGELRLIQDLESGLDTKIIRGIEISNSVRARNPYFPVPFVLPLGMLWPGFATNTIFYAAIVWMLFAVPGAVRRRVRIKRGQCASCGYSLRGMTSDKCPECALAISPQSR